MLKPLTKTAEYLNMMNDFILSKHSLFDVQQFQWGAISNMF